MFAMMTVNELYRSFLKELKKIYSDDEAANINSMIFESIAGITREALIKEPGHTLDEKTTQLLKDSLEALKLNKPVQYVLGEAWFYKMKLKVSPAVLIPRPETEELVASVIDFLKDKPVTSVLDIGTGSGCIAIAVKKSLPSIQVTAFDVSESALEIAKENSAQQQTEIKFLFFNFLEEKKWNALDSYDVIVSNPPYIPFNELEKLSKNVTDHEPHSALFVGSGEPLIFYEKIALFGKDHLKKHGKIFVETHEDFAGAVLELFHSNDYEATIQKDMFGKQRMVIATRSR
jgi:release factor glutamine methyltransferase